MKQINDITYYKDLKADFYLPDENPYKTVVFFHGGGLIECTKKDIPMGVVEYFTKRGIGFYSFEYNMYPNAKFPSYLEECAQAIKFAFDKTKQYGGDGSIYVFGESAGAYLLMMLCTNPKYLKDVGVNPKDIRGWISEGGQLFDHFKILELEDKKDPWIQRISERAPLYFVDDNFDASPILLVVNDDDPFLNRNVQNYAFYNAVKHFKKDFDIQIVKLPDGHCRSSYNKDENGIVPINYVLEPWLNNHQ